MYELYFSDDRKMKIYDDKKLMRQELKRVFPGEEQGLDKMHAAEKARYEALFPILAHDNNSWSYFFNPEFYTKIPKFSLANTIIKEMGKYFKTEQAKLAFTFQAKYFGVMDLIDAGHNGNQLHNNQYGHMQDQIQNLCWPYRL